MSRRALEFLAPQTLSTVLPLLERNLAKLSAEKAATPAAVRLPYRFVRSKRFLLSCH